jgi:hypothetical protein
MEAGEKIDSLRPSYRYAGTARRQEWATIRRVLEESKLPVSKGESEADSRVEGNTIQLDYTPVTNGKVPVLVATTYHPNWQRQDGRSIYTATPFYMLTFVDDSVRLEFKRRWYERAAVWASAGTLGLLCVFVGLRRGKRSDEHVAAQ